MLGKITKLASAVHGGTVCQRFFERFRLFMGMHWENSVRFHQRMLNNYSDLAGQWRTKKCTNKPLQLKWYPYLAWPPDRYVAGIPGMGWSMLATAAVKQLATAQQTGGPLGEDCWSFQGMCPFFDSWSQGMKSTYQHEWSFNQWGDSMVFHEKNTCWNPFMINPKVVLKQSG